MKKNQEGFTIFELLVSIVIGTIVISILMQQLVTVVAVRRNFELENRMLNESYYIGEQIRNDIFNQQPHEIELVEDTATQTVIRIWHRYDITSGAGNVITRDCTTESYIDIIWDKVNEQIQIDDGTGAQRIHAENIKIVAGSSLSIIPLDEPFCLANPPLTDFCAPGFNEDDAVCYQGILRLELNIQIELTGGGRLDAQLYVSTIIV
jgi:type II secretory pathway pseudopilin PulG